jgi:23S rRNA (guanosine2251-2'-O)-methyltransferase
MTRPAADRIFGFNPVEAALQSGRRTIDRIWILSGRSSSRAGHLKSLARERGVLVEEIDPGRMSRLAGGVPRSAHQGVVAAVSALPYADPAEVLAACGPVSRLLIAEGVEDPRNLGALIRTAAASGAAGLFIPRRGTPGLTGTVAKAAAGAAEILPVARIGNVTAFINLLKEQKFWTIGLDVHAGRPWDRTEYPDRVAIVVGGEGSGLRRLSRETCDETVSIPVLGGVESLNVSVAAGVCLYEALRQARGRKIGG